MKAVLLLFCCCITTFLLGQSKHVDSLQRLSNQATDKIKIDVLNELAFELLSYDNKRALANAQQAYQLSKQLGYEKGSAKALIFIGVSMLTAGNTDSSSVLLKQSIKSSRRLGQAGLRAYALTYLGANYESINQRDSALFCYNEAFELLKGGNEPYYLSFLYLHLADYYKTNNQPARQLDYLKKCWAIRENLKEKKYLVWTGDILASYYTDKGDYAEAYSYLKKAKAALGKDTVDNEEISYVYKQLAIIHINEGNYAKAFDLLGKARRYFERNLDQVELVDIQSEIGYIFMDMVNFELSLKNYFEAYARAEKYQYELAQTKLLFRIAWVYYQLRQDKQAEQYIRKSLLAARANHHKAEEGFALNLLGLLAERQDKNAEAMNYFAQALTIRRSLHNSNGIASTLLNIGELLEKQGRFEGALDYERQSLAIEESTGHSLGIAYCYLGLGQLHRKMKDYKNADIYLTKAEALSRKINAGNILIDVYKNRRELLQAKSKYKDAITYSILYDNLKDSIFNQNLSNRISTLQNIFQLEQKENAIVILNQQKELQQKKLEVQGAQLRQQKIIIIAGGIGFFALCIIAFIIYQYYKRVRELNREISERNEEIQTQAEELTESNYELSKLNREIQERNEKITTQSEELTEANQSLLQLNSEINEQREEIQAQSEELTESYHVIASINEGLEQRIEERTAELKQAYKELDTFFYRSSHDFRRPLTTFMGLAEVAKITVRDHIALELFNKVNETAHNLDRMLMKLQSISDLGVQEALYKEIFIQELFLRELDLFKGELIEKNMKADVEVDPQLSFYSYPALVKIILVNLIENAIAFRASNDPHLILKAYQKDTELVLEVRDNGQGIEPEVMPRVFEMYFRGSEQSKGNGLGLYVVKKAADKLKANVNLQSIIGHGTRVTIVFPFQMGGIA